MYHSQFGEDRILARLFRDKPRGGCVEVGANDGIHGSTTLYFERLGWDCVLVEPNSDLCRSLREIRSAQVFECAAAGEAGTAILQLAEGDGLAHAVSTLCSGEEAERTLRKHGVVARPVEVETRRLDDILAESGLSAVDFVSIDVEGFELEVLKGFSLERWRPRIVIVEDNSRLKDRRVRDFLNGAGYVRFARTGVNDWYAHRCDGKLVGRARRLRYALSFSRATATLASVSVTAALARVPGVLPLARKLKRLAVSRGAAEGRR